MAKPKFIVIFKGANNKLDKVRDRKMNFLTGHVKYVNKIPVEFAELEDFRKMNILLSILQVMV